VAIQAEGTRARTPRRFPAEGTRLLDRKPRQPWEERSQKSNRKEEKKIQVGVREESASDLSSLLLSEVCGSGTATWQPHSKRKNPRQKAGKKLAGRAIRMRNGEPKRKGGQAETSISATKEVVSHRARRGRDQQKRMTRKRRGTGKKE